MTKFPVYLNSPDGKKARSKPELAQLLLKTSGEVIDLTNFDFRSGVFVTGTPRRSARKRKQTGIVDVYSKGLKGVSMVLPSVPSRQSKKVSKEPVTVVSKDNSSANSKDRSINGTLVKQKECKDDEVVSPRQIFWERRLQNINCSKNSLDDFDIFSNTNGEFRSLLHSIVKTLQIERDVANKRKPLGSVACSARDEEQSSKTLIKITKEDILRQEKQVIKARKELAKAITEYEAIKSL